MNWLEWRIWRLFIWLFWTRAPHSQKACGNRFEYHTQRGMQAYTLIIRDLREPDRYSREEVLAMLRLVRQNEAHMGWKCPEPTSSELEGVE